MPLIDAKTLAKELGFTPTQIRKLALRGKIPAYKFGSEYRFNLQAVLDSARYKNLIAESAHRAARQVGMRPTRPFIQPSSFPKKKGSGGA